MVADDFGLSAGINRGVATAYKEGIVTSASLLANAPRWEGAVSTARRLPGLKVGVHLTLVGGVPVLDPARVPTLAPEGGRFRESWREFLPAWLAGWIDREEVLSEWRVQVGRVLAAGLQPAHLDSHQHLHVLPGLWAIALQLAREFGIPRIRVPRERGAALPGARAGRRLARRALSLVARCPLPEGVPRSCDRFFGGAEAGHLSIGSLGGILRAVPEGWSELMVHPGHPEPALARDYPWGYDWETEVRALCAEETWHEVRRCGIELDRDSAEMPDDGKSSWK